MLTTYQEHYGRPAAPAQTSAPAASSSSNDGEYARQLHDDEQLALVQQLATDEALAKQLYEDQVDELCHQTAEELKPAEDASRDATLAAALSLLKPVLVLPRVNSAQHPQQDEISEDRKRLLMRLDHYSLTERLVKGDGNCQFRAVADQLYRSPMYWREVRNGVVKHLRDHKDWYSSYVPQDYHEYCNTMAKQGAWGDHVTLQAAADLYGVSVRVLTSFQESPIISVQPRESRSCRVLWLSFWAEVHYNSLYPGSEPPGQETSNEKLLGSRRLARLVHDGEWPTY